MNNHVKDEHRITCFTCQETFKNFSQMIEHRRVTHPSNKICKKFPDCDRGKKCLYKHQGVQENVETQAYQTQEAANIICRSCQQEFSDKNEMMIHRKIEHLNKVKGCKNIQAGVNCKKGSLHCWYRHDMPTNSNTSATLENTRRNTTTAPEFNLQNFPLGPTPQGVAVGTKSMELQMIHQTLQQQQQQMTTMMMAIMKLTK